MININLIKPSKDNLKLNLIIGLSLVFLSLFDVFLIEIQLALLKQRVIYNDRKTLVKIL